MRGGGVWLGPQILLGTAEGSEGSAKSHIPSPPAEGLPGSAQQVIQVDRDTVLVCFDRECPVVEGWENPGDLVGPPFCRGRLAYPPPFAHTGCVRIVNLLGEPTASLAPELTFDFPIETVGK